MKYNHLNQAAYIFLSLIVAGLIFIFRKYLSLEYLFIFEDIGTDTLTLFYPNLMDYVRIIREEGIPFYSFAKGPGQGSFSENIISPFTWIYVLLGTKYLAYGIGFVQLMKAIVIMIASFQLYKLQGLEKRAAAIGASLTSFLGYAIVGSSWYGHSTNIMFMLLFLLGLELWMVKRKWWLLPIAAVFLIGPPLFFVTEFTLIYLVIRFFLGNGPSVDKLKSFFSNAYKPFLAGLMIGAPFLGAIIYKFIYSPRVGGTESYTDSLSSTPMFATEGAEHYTTAISRFFSSDLLGTGDAFTGWGNYLEAPHFYCGLLSLLLVPQVFRFLEKKQKIVIASVLAFWAIIIVFPYFRYAFYLFMGDYYKGALSFFIPFTLVWLTVMVLDRLIRGGKLSIPLLLITGGAQVFILYSISLISNKVVIESSLRHIVLGFLILELLILLAHHFHKRKPLWVTFLAITIIAEGVVLSLPALNKRRAIKSERLANRELYQDYALESIQYIKSIEDGFFRMEKNFGSYKSGLNDSQAQGFFDTKTYRSHNNKNYVNFLIAINMMQQGDEHVSRWLGGVGVAHELHPYFGIKYVIGKPGIDSEMLNQYYQNIGEMNGLNIHKNKNFIPLGFPVTEFITENDFKGLGSYYRHVNALYNTAVIPYEDLGLYTDLNQKDVDKIGNALSLSRYSKEYKDKSFKISSFKQDEIKGSIGLSQTSMIKFSIPYDASWKAYVDGKKTKVSYIDNGMLGIYAAPGNHQITLKYRPPFFLLSVVCFFIGIGALLYFGVYKSKEEKPLVGPLSFKKIEEKSYVQVPAKKKAEKITKTAKTGNTSKKKRKKK